MYGVLSQIEAYLSLKNAWLPPIFFLDTKTTYFYLLSPDSFKPRKNIPVLVSITDRKLEYLEMGSNSCHFRINNFLLFLALLFLLKYYFLFNLFLFLRKSGGGGGLKSPSPSLCMVPRGRATEIIVEHQET